MTATPLSHGRRELRGDFHPDADRQPPDAPLDVLGRTRELALDCLLTLMELLPALVVNGDESGGLARLRAVMVYSTGP
jgi:hypothetical protein